MSGTRPGGPPERTALSWQRSELAVAFVAAFVAVAALRLEVLPIALAAGLVAIGAVGVAVAGRPRGVRHGQVDEAPWTWLANVAVATAVVGVLGTTLGVVELLRRF